MAEQDAKMFRKDKALNIGDEAGSELCEADILLDVLQVSKIVRCSPRTVRRLADRGVMPRPVNLGRLVRWRKKEVVRWIERGCPRCN